MALARAAGRVLKGKRQSDAFGPVILFYARHDAAALRGVGRTSMVEHGSPRLGIDADHGLP